MFTCRAQVTALAVLLLAVYVPILFLEGFLGWIRPLRLPLEPLILGSLSNGFFGVVHHEGAAEQYSRLFDAVVLVTERAHTTCLH